MSQNQTEQLETQKASNTMINAINMAQKRGAYSLQEAAEIYKAMEVLDKAARELQKGPEPGSSLPQ